MPCLTALIVGIAIALYWQKRSEPYDGDSVDYIAMANGHIAEVRQPYTGRVLRPAVAGFVARTTGLSIDISFFATQVVSLAILVSAGLSLIMRHIRSAEFAVSIVLSPMLLSMFRDIYMPDCMNAALLALFLLLLTKREWWYALPFLFLAQVTRESTILLTFVLVLVAGYKRKWKVVGAAVLATLLGIGVVAGVAHRGLKNIHEMNTLVYMAGHLPFNFFTNYCGVRIWTDTNKHNV